MATLALRGNAATPSSSNHYLILFLSALLLISIGYALYERRMRMQTHTRLAPQNDTFTREWKRPVLEIPLTPEEECEAGLSGLRKRGRSAGESREGQAVCGNPK